MCKFIDDPMVISADWCNLMSMDMTNDSAAFVGPEAGLYGAVLHEALVERVCSLKEFDDWYVIRHFSDISFWMFGIDCYFVTLALHDDSVMSCTLSDVDLDVVYSHLSFSCCAGDTDDAFIDDLCGVMLRVCRFVDWSVRVRGRDDFSKVHLVDMLGEDHPFKGRLY